MDVRLTPDQQLLQQSLADFARREVPIGGRADIEIVLNSEAVALEDDLTYMEPPDWFCPTRESLGGLLLQAGKLLLRLVEQFHQLSLKP